MTKLRIGVVGAGTIAQVEHIPNLIALHDLYDLAGVADPSAITRDFVTATWGVRGFDTPEALLAEPLDAILIASPDPLHRSQVLAALAKGLHVFCEKPLCYSPSEIGEIIAARDAAGRVVQVGTMKRFDPAYRLALDSLPGTAQTLRMISVEVNDPDAWPYVAHRPLKRGDDIDRALVAQAVAAQRAQVSEALGSVPSDLAYRGFTGAYSSSMVHDVNAVHGILERLGVPDGEVVGATIFADGEGGHGTVSLLGGKALWTMTHLAVPGLADYRERITVTFDDAVLELVFPSPYLNHQPTRLTIRTSDGHTARETELRPGYGEAFVEELRGFHAAITAGAPVVNTPEHAARDMALLVAMARRFMAGKG
ncbi:MAG: Gfo/Idh/MocA family oxidoreductase [Rhizobiaceae bacterium]|nr:Gfo/Idh/MocA family oxidoreductase [Rhizobiaceae bacterium]